MLSSSGILASSPMGWPSIFYISGTCGILWSILWFFYGGNSPAEYKSISIEEKEFIQSSLGSEDHSVRFGIMMTNKNYLKIFCLFFFVEN